MTIKQLRPELRTEATERRNKSEQLNLRFSVSHLVWFLRSQDFDRRILLCEPVLSTKIAAENSSL